MAESEEDDDVLTTTLGVGAVGSAAAATTYYYADTWKAMFNDTVASAKKAATEMSNGYWDKLGQFALGDKFVIGTKETAGSTFTDILSGLPQGVANHLKGYCAKDGQTCRDLITPTNLALLSVAGISVGAYLYIKFSGTKKEKTMLAKRLRDARRLSEDVSDDANYRSLNRRRTGQLKQYSELSDSFSSPRTTRRNRPRKYYPKKYSRRSRN